jgi:hypothetical protein
VITPVGSTKTRHQRLLAFELRRWSAPIARMGECIPQHDKKSSETKGLVPAAP